VEANLTDKKTVLTTDQAMHRLGISRGTFFARLREKPEIKPANYNPNLKKQHNPVWRIEDVDKLGIPINIDPNLTDAPTAANT
jgi:hypothetical protein